MIDSTLMFMSFVLHILNVIFLSITHFCFQTLEYMLEITASDGGQPSLFSQVLLKIKLLDVNDNTPVFDQENYTAIVQVSITEC